MDNILKAEVDSFMKGMINKIKQKVPKDKGDLFNSISYVIEGNKVSILMEDYGKFIDEGVSGVKSKYNTPYSYKNKKPPISAISSWAKNKGINPYVLQKSLYNKGIKPRNFFKNVYDDYIDQHIDDLVKTYADSIEKQISKKINK